MDSAAVVVVERRVVHKVSRICGTMGKPLVVVVAQ